VAIRVVPGTASSPLAAAIAARPDGELQPTVAEVRGEDVYVVQPTEPPVNEHVIELLLLLDACRRTGTERITAVAPYFGYARQDRRGAAGGAVGARVIVDALAAAGADHLIVVDPHTAAVDAMCAIPVEMLTARAVLAAALDPILADSAVIIAPDLGAVKLAEQYASQLGRRPVVVVRKTPMSGEVVEAPRTRRRRGWPARSDHR
jgi:ribose-phosphate pyrophosphokinase